MCQLTPLESVVGACIDDDGGSSSGGGNGIVPILTQSSSSESSSNATSSCCSDGCGSSESDDVSRRGGEGRGLRVLICSESVPPQVNGIARRIGMYADGLRGLGCDVGE